MLAAAALSPDKIRVEIYWLLYCKRYHGILKLEGDRICKSQVMLDWVGVLPITRALVSRYIVCHQQSFKNLSSLTGEDSRSLA
jgi:hypothetical protein